MSYLQLQKHFDQINAYSHVLSICGWDEQVNMPKQSHEQRAKSISHMHIVKHGLVCDERIAAWLELAKSEDLNTWQRANLREIEKSWSQATCLTPELIDAQVKAVSKCQQAWSGMRAQNNWTEFMPLLHEVIVLAREEAKLRAQMSNMTPYQALVDLYDPGQKVEDTVAMFDTLKQFLPDFIQEVQKKQSKEDYLAPAGRFDCEQQKQLCLELMETFGFDFNHGRLDVSQHPFCGGVPSDVRITTRYSEHDFTESVMGVIHETGHASYEQGLPAQWVGQPVGKALGMSLHESQSLFYEMQIGRNPAMLQFMAPLFKKYLYQDAVSEDFWNVKNLTRLYHRVSPGYIRTSADEVTYPMHVILRFELEQAIIAGDLDSKDIPAAWDEKMHRYLGVDTRGNYKDGCMQDIHWTSGSFGYFPSYTLGAMTAAQLFKALKADYPDIDKNIERGDLSQIQAWLKEKVWSQASLKHKNELLKDASGEVLNVNYFIDHLQARYAE